MPLFRPYEHRRSSDRGGSAALSGTLFTTDEDELGQAEDPGPAQDNSEAPVPAGDESASARLETTDSQPTATAPGAEVGKSRAKKATPSEAAPRARLQPKQAKGEKKDRPTRTRAEAERARREQLHPTLTPKEAKARNRELRFQARQDALKKQESTPERELLRDYIDSRWTVAEFLLPVFVLLWATSLATVTNARLQYILSLVMVVALGLAVINMWWLWRGFKREAHARLKHPNFRGLLMYGVNRMIFIRRFRRPPPRIPRGGEY